MAKGLKSSIRSKFSVKDFVKEEVKKLKKGDFSFLRTSTQQDIGAIVINRIVERTQTGIGADASGKAVRFRSYTEDYKKTRNKQGLGIWPVDLTFYGDMLNGLHVDKLYQNGNFRITVERSDEGKARGAHEGIVRKDGSVVKRPFLGLTDTDKRLLSREISEIVKEDYDRYLRSKKKG